MSTIDHATDTRPIGTGHSADDDPARAGVEALAGALAGQLPRRGDLVFIFVDSDRDARTLISTVIEAASPATVVGSSAHGSFSTTVPGPHGVTVIYLPAGEVSIGVASAPGTDNDLYFAARDAAQEAKARAGEAHPHSVLVIMSSQTGSQRDVVRGAYEVTGARVPLVGGAALVDETTDRSWLVAGDGIIESGVVAVWLNSPRPLGVSIDHGWYPVSRPLLVTAARDNVILELDGRPALDAYLEARGRPFSTDHEGRLGWEAIDLPLGLPTIGGGYEVRHIFDRTEDGGLEMFGYVHDHAVLRVMTADHDELVEGARRAVRRAVSELGRPARGVIVFSCTARAMLFGDRADDERVAIQEELGTTPAGGYFTSGEYARTAGSTGFHNASVAVLAL